MKNVEYQEIYDILKKIIEENNSPFDADTWLATPNNMFGGVSPNFLIEKGKANKVLLWLKSVEEGY